jgi:hypothetical protein
MRESIVAILLAIIGVAVIAIILSGNSQTSSVIGAGGTAFANAIKCAVAPITGGSCPTSASTIFTSSSTFCVPGTGMGC